MSPDPIIELHRVTISKGDAKILRDITLKICPGERLVILGPNGSGKSSLIKTFTGEYRHDTTDERSYVKILGSEYWDIHDVHKAFGLVSSDLQFDFRRDMDGLEAVLSGFFGSIGTNRSQSITREMNGRARKALLSVGSSGLGRKPLSVMSMGEARRVIMARALVNEPEALILDEPMNGLDLTGKHLVRDAMRSLVGRGKALVLVTQDPSDIIPEIDRIILVKNGKIFLDDGIDALNEKNLSTLFKVPLNLCRYDGRWWAWS
ncbi:MAG TPA: ATP-binding cassette domain-containing protein [Methanomassiliicoccales archaeon]|jgi:iron complex transport system ATP-binding protein